MARRAPGRTVGPGGPDRHLGGFKVRIVIISIGKVKAAYARAGIDVFLARLARYVSVDVFETKDIKRGQKPLLKVLEDEAETILRHIPKGAYLVGLDERGRAWRSEELARWLNTQRQQSQRTIAFVIGGPDGFADSIRERFDRIWSLGSGTLPHDLAKLVLCEQLYRAESINAGHPYHRA